MRKYIEVWEIVRDHTVEPLIISFDGMAFEVTEVTKIGYLTEVEGTYAIPYVIEIKNQSKTIYKQGGKWFIIPKRNDGL